MAKIRSLLLNLEKGWRGGENQILLLARYLKQHDDFVSIAYPANSLGLQRYKTEISTLALPSSSSWHPKNVSVLVQYIQQNKIQIIHANSSKSHALALRVKKRLPHLKLVVHRRVATAPKMNFFTRRQYLSPLVDSYVSLSTAISEVLIDYGIPSDKIVKIPSGVAIGVETFDKCLYKQKFATSWSLDPNHQFIGMACALAPEKGIDVFLQFAKLLLQERQDVTFLIAGAGPLEDDLKKLAQDLEIAKHVCFVGFLNSVTDYLRSLDVFCMPTRKTKKFREGLGSVLLEAIMARTSIIASGVDGILDVIIDNETGHLTEPDSPKKMLSVFQSLRSETEHRIQENAIQHVLKDFTATTMAQRNRENYLRLLRLTENN